ncbi:MAG: hypothetical protein OXM55_03125 [Bdellovibrionales bacterium]|nr:hypothetical protein [Bdellovibrionales bacterium]
MKFLYLFLFSLSLFLISFFAKTETKKPASLSNNKPLVLQWEVSHSRNTDQISLIFKKKSVELVTNTSSYQKGRVVRLGRFEASLDQKLKKLKDQVTRHYKQLRKTVPVSSLIKDSRIKPPVDPHAPILHINEEQIKYEQAHFKTIANIIYTVWEHKWTCIECALYDKNKKFILRTVKKRKSGPESETKDKAKKRSKVKKREEKTQQQKFLKKLLNCLPKGKTKVECIDPQFGIFEI